MIKLGREALLREGERLLAEWGVSGEAGATDLAPWIGRQRAADLALAERLGALATEESVAVLRRLDHVAADKLVHKEVKRALYRLQQRGVRVAAAAAPTPAPAPTPALEGHVSAVDGRGDQLVWLVKPRPGGLAHLFAVINDPEGMREVELHLVSRKALRTARAELAAKHDLHLVSADWRYCDFLMHRAFLWARQRQTPASGDYLSLRAQLITEPVPPDRPPLILSQLDAAAIRGDATLLTRSVELLEEKEFRTWLFPQDQVQPYLEELGRIKDSPLVLNPVQQEERSRAVVERAIGETFAGAGGRAYARRLFEMAYVLWATQRAERAKQALAVALALEQGARDIPFCEALVRGSLGVWFRAAVEAEAERAKSSLLMTPQQFMAERQRR